MGNEKKITVIGAGISGLTTAYLLLKHGFKVRILEKSERYGGSIRSEKSDGFLLEHGPNSTLETTPLIDELLGMLGIRERKIYASSDSGKRYILKNGVLNKLPTGPVSFFTTKLFSTSSKFRLLKEPFIKTKSHPEETLAEFTKRRLGREFLDYAINPFVAGVFAGDPENLNVKTAFPKLYDLEQNYGSLIGGMFKSRKERRLRNEESKQSAKMISFSNGMQELTDAIYLNLKECIYFNCKVTGIKNIGSKWYVNYSINGETREEVSDFIIISVPAYAASPLISSIDPKLSYLLEKIYYPPVNVFITAFRKEDIEYDLDGFGFLIPEKENRKFLGSLWSSVIFKGRANPEHHLLTNFIGGSRSPELASISDEETAIIITSELKSILGLKNKARFQKIIRWDKAIPQYGRNHNEITGRIEELMNAKKGIYFCSNFYKGISVSDCIKNAFAVKDKIIKTK